MTKGDFDSAQSSTAVRKDTTRSGLGVLAKLVALITAVVTLVVATLALYFPTRQLRELESDLNQRAAAYCHLLAHQARSAVAFDDQEMIARTRSRLGNREKGRRGTLFRTHGCDRSE